MRNTKLGYLGIDQYGQHYKLDKYPRKELCDKLGRQHVDKMFCDHKDGPPVQTGYVIGGLWITLYEVHEWSKAV